MFTGEVMFGFHDDPPDEPYITPADEGEVEFVSPSVPGRRVRRNPSKED
jgi:hypothetical protein